MARLLGDLGRRDDRRPNRSQSAIASSRDRFSWLAQSLPERALDGMEPLAVLALAAWCSATVGTSCAAGGGVGNGLHDATGAVPHGCHRTSPSVSRRSERLDWPVKAFTAIAARTWQLELNLTSSTWP
jgi:hypothetical protein